MELNKRCLSILQYLQKEDDYVKIKTLANMYNLSDRAIRYNVDKIENFLVKNGFPYLERQHQKGVRLPREKELHKFIDSFTNEYTPYKYVYSKEERFKFVITYLLQSEQPVSTLFFQKKLCISKNTILKEIEIIQEWLKNRNLNLIKKPRIGIYIEGREIDKRKAIIEILSETVSAKDIFTYINGKSVKSKINNLQFSTLFAEVDMDFLNSMVRKAECDLGREFSDEAYGSLITHLAIMVKRIQLKKSIFLPAINMKSIENTKEYEVAVNITKDLEDHYQIDIPIEEVNYITLHFLGAKVLKSRNIYTDSEGDSSELRQICINMTNEIEKIYGVDFQERKEEIITGLLLHLRPTIYRVKYNLKLNNPLYHQIISKYNKLFRNTKIVMRHLEEYIGERVNDHEVSYIACHFGAALENMNKHMNEKAKIILVCGTGIGTAKMVASQIDKEFNVDIVDTISSRMVPFMEDRKVDFVISTVEIPDMDKDSYIKISPLLLKKDIEKLKQYLQTKYRTKDDYSYELNKVNRLIDIVEKYCVIKDKGQLQYEFMYELMNDEQLDLRGEYIYMLNDLITREFIKLNVECEDWIEAIQAGTLVLEKKGFVEKRYSEAIIDIFKENGPYMVVAPGIVLSHGRPEDGVNKLSMSLITLKKPVKFGNELNDPVKLVITLAAADNETHLKALSQLMELLMDAKNLKRIMQSNNKDEIIEIINKHSK